MLGVVAIAPGGTRLQQPPDGPGGVESAGDVASDFFRRHGLHESTERICRRAARRAHCGRVDVPPSQGYCSYTLNVGNFVLVQFRPQRHRLELSICEDAVALLPRVAPKTAHLGSIKAIRDGGTIATENVHLEVYCLEKLRGEHLLYSRAKQCRPSETSVRRKVLLEDVADMFAQTWMHNSQSQRGRRRAGSLCGRIGASLKSRLKLLSGLASEELRRVVSEVEQHLEAIERLPWCLTHGDLVPSNILVHPQSGRLTGLIDWAEGEWLPMGIGLYGVEELLGEETGEGEFEYFADHETLRRVFWERLLSQIEGTEVDKMVKERSETICLARKLGILLWRGIAFDDGKLDRAVDVENDANELRKLEMFLAQNPPEAIV